MIFLIDTNILIHLEDEKVVSRSFSKFYKTAISNKCSILYHPKAVPIDISRDKNDKRREIILSKLNKYETLLNYGIPTEDFLTDLKNKKINDQIDNCQLYQVEKKYVNYFITEDVGIHKKAKIKGLDKFVLNIEEATKLVEDKFTLRIPTHPILKEQSVRDIDPFYSSAFFDSLRDDYGHKRFTIWFEKCLQQNRKCYSLTVDGLLNALLIYNLEKTEDHQIPNIYEKVLKICTLKVMDSAFGVKLGELFLNKMFQYCINHKINYLYLTVYEKQTHLINLLSTFGFQKSYFTNSIGKQEIRMLKSLDKNKISSSCNETLNHPFYFDNEKVGKFVIPIRPNFYSRLFKDGSFRMPGLFDETEDSLKEIEGNTIVKAYVSGAQIKTLKKGDLLFFYSSQGNQAIEPIGVLEKTEHITDFDKLWQTVKKKTVFSQAQLKERFDEKGVQHVITFRLITYLEKQIPLRKIKELPSLRNNIPTITRLSEDDYRTLKNEGYFDKRYIID